MPDFRAYGPDGKGGMKEVPPKDFANFLGVSEFDANLILKGMNITKILCAMAGRLENPPLIWNENMPESLIEFVASHIADKLKVNPAWPVKDFDWKLLYEDDLETLKYR